MGMMDKKRDVLILGAGLSAISTAYFLQDKPEIGSITLLEKEDRPGGLCRSIRKDGYTYDIGPHILFSKDKEMLELMLSVLDEGRNDLVRSNQILYKGRRIQYPFENDLSKLPEAELQYCINAFNNNPYEDYDVTNMIQFFLKTFGEGITNTYLRPYNEKIWKYDPAFMNTSMVERIPKPTSEEIRRSAAGETIQGYLHQLYFSFPSQGGIQAVPDGFLRRLKGEKCRVVCGAEVTRVEKAGERWRVLAGGETYEADQLISTIPVQALTGAWAGTTPELQAHVDRLRYNSIIISFVRLPYDLCGENFAFMIPDKNVLFHRISKMDFLGEAYHRAPEEATYMVEVTYRKNDQVDRLTDGEFRDRIRQGLVDIGFAKAKEDAEFIDITKYQYAYVIYDLEHTQNMAYIRKHYSDRGIVLNGRFGNFEYWNMDKILRESFELSKRL